MSGQHCMMCKLRRKEFNKNRQADGLPWTFPDIVQIGEDVCTGGEHSLMGVKQKPWWPFRKFEHLMVPLLHCMIGVGNNFLNKFCDGVNEFIENKSIQQITIEQALTNYELVVLETVKRRDDFDLSLEGKKLKSLQAKVASRKCKRKNKNLEAATHDVLDADILRIEHELTSLLAIQNKMVEKLTQTREIISNKQKYLCTLRSLASKSADSLETKLFKVLKGIG